MSLQNQIIETIVKNLNSKEEIFEFVKSVDAALRLHKGASFNTYVTISQPKHQQKEIIKEDQKHFTKRVQYIKKEKQSTYQINPRNSVPYVVETASNGSVNILQQQIEIPCDLGTYTNSSVNEPQVIEPLTPIQN